VSEPALDALVVFRSQLDKLIDSVGHPDERRIRHGNLRREIGEYSEGNGRVTNVAIVYETPGGSTSQLNLSYDHRAGEFSFLDHDLETRVATTQAERALQYVAEEVRAIPNRREELLKASVRRWHDEGREVIAELNKLLQNEFLGGRITIRELQLGLRYATELRRGEPGAPLTAAEGI